MRLEELNAMRETTRQRIEKAEARLARLKTRDAELADEQKAEADRIRAALKEAE